MKRFLAIVSILGVVAGVARAQQAQPAQGMQASPFDRARRYDSRSPIRQGALDEEPSPKLSLPAPKTGLPEPTAAKSDNR
jgi:hypothetical protein